MPKSVTSRPHTCRKMLSAPFLPDTTFLSSQPSFFCHDSFSSHHTCLHLATYTCRLHTAFSTQPLLAPATLLLKQLPHRRG